MNPDLRQRAYWAVRREVGHWELIRELATALEAVEQQFADHCAQCPQCQQAAVKAAAGVPKGETA